MFQTELHHNIKNATRKLLNRGEAGQARALNRIAVAHLLHKDLICSEEELFKVIANITSNRETIYKIITLTVPNIYGRYSYIRIIDDLGITVDDYVAAMHALCGEYRVVLSTVLYKYAG